jgi:protein involved in polysaccharide export with SLBB domain
VASASDLEVVEQSKQPAATQQVVTTETGVGVQNAVVEAAAPVASDAPQRVTYENGVGVQGAKSDVVVPASSEAAPITQDTKPQSTASLAPAQESVLERSSEVTLSKKKLMPAPVVVAPGMGEPTKYTLGVDDVIEVSVRRHPEFTDHFLINGEGKIQYKFVGDIEIKGLTKTEVKDKIKQILSKFIINPEVDVTIAEYRSKVIYVIGEVGAPGKYYMKADKISLREAVVQAGLPTLSASMRKTQLIRPDKSGKPMEIKVDLYALLYEGKLNLDQDMIPGDVLHVPATIFAKIMRIINPVAQPILQSDTVRRVGTGGF